MPDIITLQLAFFYPVSAFLFGYLLGSIPFGLLLSRFAGLGDIRNIGSGNIGATNVLRTGNRKIAAIVLLADLLKGTMAVIIAKIFDPDLAIIAGLGAFTGHLFPVWLKFKGGKGIATYIGILLALVPLGVFIFAIIWLSVAFISRYSSLAAICAVIIVPISLYLMGYFQFAHLFALLSIISIFRHHENIRKLLSGTENKIGHKKS